MRDADDAKPIPASNASIQNANWSGSLPILLSLAPTSLSSPAPPRPIHKMISRATYLHVALHEEVMQFSGYAPIYTSAAGPGMTTVEEPPDSPTEGGDREEGSGQKKEEGSDDATTTAKDSPSKSPHTTEQSNAKKREPSYPECWFEDEESGTPLRWHLFVGVLYDLMKGKSMFHNTLSWKGTSNEPMQHNFLPWRIRVHFTSYPSDIILPLDDGSYLQKQTTTEDSHNDADIRDRITTLVRRIFRNSLKQALFLQYGSSKVAMAITKSSHETIWDAVLQSNYGKYHEVNVDLQSGISSPPMSTQLSNLDHIMIAGHDHGDDDDIPQSIPVRLMLNGMPAVQKPTKHRKEGSSEQKRPTEILEQLGTCQAPPYTTLGDVLANYLPGHFSIDPSTGWANATSDSTLCYYIQGVQPSLKCAMVDLWRALSHPDHFLYIIVVTE